MSRVLGVQRPQATEALRRYCPFTPTPKQAELLSLPHLEVLYGGSAGPGKSVGLLMAALQYVDISSYAALLLRRTYADLSLPGALMDKAFEWLSSTDASWSDKTKTWEFPSGATVTFGYLDSARDKYRYQSSEYAAIFFDELTQFPEEDYRYLFSRLRRLKTSNTPLRMWSASNPGNIGHEWVKRRFMVEASSSRCYLRAMLEDNPYLDREEYERSLAQLDPITREQLLNGDWTARQSGGMFRREWFEVVEVAPVNARWVRYWDLAATESGNDPDWTAGCKMGVAGDSMIYIADMRRLRGMPASVESLVRQTAMLDGHATRIYMEQEPGSSGVNTIHYYRSKVLPGFAFYPDRVTGSKEMRAAPLSSQAEAGNVKLVNGPWIGAFLDEAESFPLGAHDDAVDAASGAFGCLTRSAAKEIMFA